MQKQNIILVFSFFATKQHPIKISREHKLFLGHFTTISFLIIIQAVSYAVFAHEVGVLAQNRAHLSFRCLAELWNTNLRMCSAGLNIPTIPTQETLQIINEMQYGFLLHLFQHEMHQIIKFVFFQLEL